MKETQQQTSTHLAIQSIQFNILFKSHLSITGHNTHIKQSYNNKLESHSFLSFNDNQKLVFLFSDFNTIRICAKICNLILNERRNVLIVNIVDFVLCM
jgi:hypothetical protein